ncbi:MAG: hypothetical protein JSS96_12870 [Bacteroidetes bacterium]|nr:hypothetical protein [Bacteroidota bacterium]
MSFVSFLSLAAKKETKKAAETYYCVSFRGGTIGLLWYCSADRIDSDGFTFRHCDEGSNLTK